MNNTTYEWVVVAMTNLVEEKFKKKRIWKTKLNDKNIDKWKNHCINILHE